MGKKITWNKIYNDFKQRHPRLRKEVVHWRPHDFATIKLWLKDGSKLIYDYDQHKAMFIND